MKLKRFGRKSGLVFLVLIFAICISVIVWLYLFLKTDKVSENMKNDQVIKTLFVMTDKNKVLFTDVFIYYPVSQRGALIDIVGNTGAIYSSIGRVDRIDAVYEEKGMGNYLNEIEKLIGLPIPFYISIDLEDFGVLTDMLGGMKVFVPSPVDITGEDGTRYLLPSGAVNLDGDKVKTYLLYQDEENQDDKSEDRKQNVMVAFLSALSSNASSVLNRKNFSLYSSKFTSSVKGDDLYKLFSEIVQIDSERLIPQKIMGQISSVSGKKLLLPYYDGQLIKEVAKQTISSLISDNQTMSERVYVLEIQNGTTVQGLARNTSVLLQSAGYDVLSTVNASKGDYEISITDNFAKTVIINHIGNLDVAKNLGDFIRCENIVEEEIKPESEGMASESQVDFTIILGRDFDGRYVR